MKPLADCQLYTFVDTAYLNNRSPADIAEALCLGGSDIIQLRAKSASVAEIRNLAYLMAPILEKHSVHFVVNDHPEIAREVGAICHLGQEDFFDAGRNHVSELGGISVGLSTHAPDQAKRAVAAAPVYIATGPVFATATKAGAKPVTTEYIRWVADNVSLPWFAIGGIDLANVQSVLDAGAVRICVVSAILNASDIAGACHSFRKRLGSPA